MRRFTTALLLVAVIVLAFATVTLATQVDAPRVEVASVRSELASRKV